MTERLSREQIAALKHLAITCAQGGFTMLTRDQRAVMVPLWRRGLIEMWFRCIPDEGSQRSAFFRPSRGGWRLIAAIFGRPRGEATA